MHRLLLSSVLLIVLLQPAPTLTAHWVGPHAVELRWDTPGCLYRKPLLSGGVFLGCHAAGAMRLPPGPPADAAYWPAAGDRYVLLSDHGDVWAELGWVVRLPLVRSEVGQRWAVALPLVRR